jgi:hypothetical protein
MADSPDYGLLKEAYAIVDGIPAEAITLDWNKTKEGPSLVEGTVFHPARWLAIHPDFQKLGLSMAENGKHLLFNGQSAAGGTYSDPLAQVFGLPVSDIVSMFAERGTRMGESIPTLTDKDVWQNRVRSYLETHAGGRKRVKSL